MLEQFIICGWDSSSAVSAEASSSEKPDFADSDFAHLKMKRYSRYHYDLRSFVDCLTCSKWNWSVVAAVAAGVSDD